LFKKIFLILILIISLALTAKAATLSGGISIEGVPGNYTDGAFTFSFISGISTGKESGIGYNSSKNLTYFTTNTLNWKPPVTWGPGNKATVNITCTREGITYTGSSEITYPITSFGVVNLISAAGPPAGIVPLFISRDGSNIKISWEASKYPTPKIFFMTGDGTGSYSNTYTAGPPANWTQVDSTNAASLGFNFSSYGSGSILHLAQVGGGSPEAYYKGLIPSSLTNLSYYIPSAEAVGKVNFVLSKNATSSWNFVSSPLIFNNLDQIWGTDFTNGDQLWVWNDAEQKFFAPITFSGGTWGTGNLNPGYGYLFNLAGTSPKTGTAIGNVNTSALSRTISVKPGTPSYGWNVIGNPQPVLSPMTGFVSGKSAASDSIWEWDNVNQKFLAPLVFDGTGWPTGAQLKIMNGYGYNHTGSGFGWQVPAIAP